MTELHWLPEIPDWRGRLRGLAKEPGAIWDNAVVLAGARINFVLTNALDETLRRLFPGPPEGLATKPVRLAVLGSSTLAHLLPAIRVAGLRRSTRIDTGRERLWPVPVGIVRPAIGAACISAERRAARSGLA